MDRPRVLLVDDEPAVLEGLQLVLRKQFDSVTATSGPAGLERLGEGPPFVVVVSDMRMPGMDGAAFLARVRLRQPDATRVLLTGYADLTSAIAAVNDGQIFRFLTKPCPADTLIAALKSAAEQNRLINAERELLENTLRGAVKTLTATLALANPTAFGRGERLRATVSALAAELGVSDRWHLEVAALLSPLGCVTLPPETLERYAAGQPLTATEAAMVARLPALAADLLSGIPRLDPVRDALLAMNRRWDGGGEPGPSGEALPLGARLIKLAADLDTLQTGGATPARAIETLRARGGWYDPRALEALRRTTEGATAAVEREVALGELRPGMVFAQDVRTPTGLLLVARGHPVTASLIERLRNMGPAAGLRGRVRVVDTGT